MTALVCVHHFIVATPAGATCEGVCRKCHEVRTYSSSGDNEGVWPAAMQAKRKRAGAAMRAKTGGARSVAQAVKFYGGLDA